MCFYELFHISFCNFTQLPFPVIACTTYAKFVKSLQARVWSVNFTNFLNRIFGMFLTFGPAVHTGAKKPLPLWCLDERTRSRLESEMIPFERWKINGKYFFIIGHNINSWTIDLSFTTLSPRLQNKLLKVFFSG